MTTPPGIAGVFDRAADSYDDVGVPWFRPIAAGLVEELAVEPGERVLDIGCGRGAALFPLADAVGGAGRVLGIDLAPRMVERTAADARDLPQVEVRVGDATAPGLPTASFDVVASALVLFFLPDPGAAVRAWAELLVDGGRMGVTTFGPQDPRWRAVDEVFDPHLPPAMLDARTSGRVGPFSSDSGVEGLLRDAGLREVRTAHRTVEAVFRDADQLLDFTWSHGQRAMWEVVPTAEHAALARRIADIARQHGDGTGRLVFNQEIRHTLGRR
ncbi:class I SAM-dependent methyltransferase [Pseudonocardia abyssalis]|uniref:Methyltransferase domain-containing protein n=1 Tax=Pseudonocardia abyssalis TaxID=2792008 RepID=A0ABS6UM91_9PSEU|nr:methyltransferase domain-containing protein [Pseudonocardia abyssalis]MBW0116924.1 methyltransferase domain-containing protein [Pseudonocardia abyssalis]MBW0133368.1 methyltransferase domain-containing protein [Pseudonocardia abyssalis]